MTTTMLPPETVAEKARTVLQIIAGAPISMLGNRLLSASDAARVCVILKGLVEQVETKPVELKLFAWDSGCGFGKWHIETDEDIDIALCGKRRDPGAKVSRSTQRRFGDICTSCLLAKVRDVA